MHDDQFLKLFKYIEEFRRDVDKCFEVMDAKFTGRFDQLESVIDAYAGKLDTYAQEFAALDHKVARLERYIEILAEKAGVDLTSVRM